MPPPEWNSTEVSYPEPSNLGALLVNQFARADPSDIALSFGRDTLTYADLDRASNRLANHLITLGVGPNVLVSIVAERSFEMVVALVAVVKAGGAYVPVDPDYPADRVEFMIRDSGSPVLLTQQHLMARLPAGDATVVPLDGPGDEAPTWHHEASHTSVVERSPDHLAYMIYTSGSTGQPKGAMNSHGAIVNRLLWMQERYQLSKSDRVLQKTPFSFDVSVWEFFWPLIVGARMVIARPGGHRDASYLASLIAREKVTVCHFVPSMLHAFLSAPDLPNRCATLRHVICSGEALTRSLQDRLFSISDSLELHNLYGPTEAAVDVTHFTCSRSWDDDVVPIGRPISNTRIHVLDDEGEPVPVGEVGELHIAGVQVAKGYHRRPRLTAERFIPDPFSPAPGARMYKSGDLARWREDGNLEFLGRIDHQVKIRGMRVELGEIEATLETHPGIERTAVLAREDSPGQKRLVAYVVAGQDKRSPSLSELREFVGEQLPDYMVPASVVHMDALPLTANGKLDRKQLPAPTRQRPELDQSYVAPRDELERFICDRWSSLLQIDGVGTRDRFFDLGGDSLLAAEFIRAVEKELDENIYVVSIFDSPTPAEYASFLRNDYADAVRRRFGSGIGMEVGGSSVPRLTDGEFTAFEQVIPRLGERPAIESGEPNPPAIFILAPPRSGTTLLRVMLAGHPSLFAAAELQLLCFHTLSERRTAFSGKFSLWLEGAIRAIMELRDCDVVEAQHLMEGYERSGLTTKQFYARLQSLIGDRMLVDKSPSYALDVATLRKAERDFEDPIYLQLVRHPYAMVKSFARYHMEQVLYLRRHDFTARQLAELVWTSSHETVNGFLADVPAGRKALIRYEDLVRHPERVLREVCDTIGLEFHSNLLHPYDDLETKMVDGIHEVSAPMGDTHLLEKSGVDATKADDWRGVLRDDFLSERTWHLAEQFGYERPAETPQAPSEVTTDIQNRRRARRSGLRRARALRSQHRQENDDA